ncbi:sucrose cleavage family protein [Aspergillus heteromorphus CBS 117.55]|uniref:Altered inheritance of mitochondria protein 32 n=1 Tax=Aspergillus heteromorphus CBS 117.55 TaxID=1448321 RepID=A0A317W1V7_9EURO|nr:sucrose cleavage family protein [Aspergillus heteromorphus CBS 117.55]PWY79227.1 sucrose cleavage family protein [Aspergillus heteromorphus CBS 117.55]
MPAPIDHDQPLNGTMAAYAQQLLICTGQKDWTSRIEEDGQGQSWGDLVRGLKGLLGRGGEYADPFNNILITNSSFTPSASSSTTSQTASAFLFPSFKYFPSVPVPPSSSAPAPANSTTTDLSTFVRAFLLPRESRHGGKTREQDLATQFPDAIDLQHSPVVLICGHGGRDMRCGVMAPVLEQEFTRVLQSKGYTSDSTNPSAIDSPDRAHVGLISHVGGHKYAGNVIVYIPPGMKVEGGDPHPLAGKGIWYGRIEPRHVQGVVEETILGGRVIADHFRGGIDSESGILRL